MRILALLSFLSLSVFALEINVTRTNCNTGGLLTTANCNDIDTEISSIVNGDLPDVDAQKYADGTASATSIVNAGRGSDYGQNFDLFTLKLAGGVALSSEDGFGDSNNINGLAFGGGITAGLNMDILPIAKIGFLDITKLDLFFNFSSATLDNDFEAAKAKGSMGGFGFMARYRLLEPRGIKSLAQWGGIQIHTGFQRNTMDISYTQSFDDETVSIDAGGGNSIVGNFSNANGTFDLESEATVIPIEVSTYARFLYVFTLYGGAGLDIVSGKSDIRFNGSGNVSAGVNSDNGDYTADLSANESASGSPEATNYRAFIGMQLNIPIVSFYVHANKNLSEDVLGVNLGLNIAW